MYKIIDHTFTLYNILLIICIVYFPFHNPIVHTVIQMWWVRVAYLILICIYTIYLQQYTTGILTSILFVMATNLIQSESATKMRVI